jgi:hypothetical protein
VRGWVASLVLLINSAVVRTAHVINGVCGAPVHVSSWKGGVMRYPCCLGTKESRSDLLKIDTPLYPHIAAVHGGKCSVLISDPVRQNCS